LLTCHSVFSQTSLAGAGDSDRFGRAQPGPARPQEPWHGSLEPDPRVPAQGQRV